VPVWPEFFGEVVRASDERLEHAHRRDDIRGQDSQMALTLIQPDFVVQSRKDPEVRLYHRRFEVSPVGDKLLCVVVRWKPGDCFLLSAYHTRNPKKGEQLWPATR
jgi:hypothetical protein